ncbi:hypothetical protein AVEN_220041-1 [Araneus ventricosus]|uniref:Tc1-like transposase DDE domain-containing protein n=1 Tax=Araneus ventricosus TaxID=182803 RepID=A0A4Y2CTL3_ARAVE|nr:hypothetical protein AVEN_220041-1 [Araneus ventricosus]
MTSKRDPPTQAKALNVSQQVVSYQIKHTLKQKCDKKSKCRYLNERSVQTRKQRSCNVHSTRFSVRTDGDSSLKRMNLGSILSYTNAKSKVQYLSRNQKRRDLTPSTTAPHPKSVMVWMGISTNGVTKSQFVQPGTKIDLQYYIQKILNPFLKEGCLRLHSNGYAVFHQDSAPSHEFRVTQKFLTDQQVQFLRPQQWMPNSPDAAPCDYLIWVHLKNKLNKRRVSTLRDLQKAIREEVKKIPQEMILRALKSWPSVVDKSIMPKVDIWRSITESVQSLLEIKTFKNDPYTFLLPCSAL